MARVSDVSSNRRFILGGAIAVWLLFAASFLMPVTSGMSNIVGWQAFWGFVSDQWDVANVWKEFQRDPLTILIFTFTCTNATMLVAPVVLWLSPRWSGWLGSLLVLGGLVPCILFREAVANHELRCGFYCWVGSIFLMAGVGLWHRLGRRRRAAHH